MVKPEGEAKIELRIGEHFFRKCDSDKRQQ